MCLRDQRFRVGQSSISGPGDIFLGIGSSDSNTLLIEVRDH